MVPTSIEVEETTKEAIEAEAVIEEIVVGEVTITLHVKLETVTNAENQDTYKQNVDLTHLPQATEVEEVQLGDISNIEQISVTSTNNLVATRPNVRNHALGKIDHLEIEVNQYQVEVLVTTVKTRDHQVSPAH